MSALVQLYPWKLVHHSCVPAFAWTKSKLAKMVALSFVLHIALLVAMFGLAQPGAMHSGGSAQLQPFVVQLAKERALGAASSVVKSATAPKAVTTAAPAQSSASVQKDVKLATTAQAAPVTLAQPPSLPPAPDYLFSSRLQVAPQPLVDVEPVFPDRAGKQNGTVVLRLLINEKGDVDNVAVVRAFPEGFFEESALAAFGQAKFSPGKVLGVPVKSQMTIEVDFAWVRKDA
jgi:periplasmic protein TonB